MGRVLVEIVRDDAHASSRCVKRTDVFATMLLVLSVCCTYSVSKVLAAFCINWELRNVIFHAHTSNHHLPIP